MRVYAGITDKGICYNAHFADSKLTPQKQKGPKTICLWSEHLKHMLKTMSLYYSEHLHPYP